ncbi:LuxR family transcriptional regulator [Mycolicibacterium moriokaense]|nr:LuxR family transcriptional regulator [Mycolicibacterium moriokaense]
MASAVSGLPTGTVTLLLADVEGSTRLWESLPEEMTAAIARLDATLTDLVAVHSGVRPVEQGEGDSFVVAFTRASDAVACALALQRAPLAPIRLRIGVNTGEIQLRDEGNYIGPTINRTARIRDLGHGGQTLLSGATESMVLDHLPDDAWLNDLGTQVLRDLPRPERVVQLCHPDIRNDFPELRTSETQTARRLPAQLTSFVGRVAEIGQLRALFVENRLVTLTGAGGSGKTRLAVQVAAQEAERFTGGVAYVDLAPITHPDLVPVAAARGLGLPDQAGRTATEMLVRFIGDSRLLMVLDNCEHLLDPCATLVETLLAACPGLVLLTTSREPIGVAGETTWRIPSLSLDVDAIELFADRARKVRPDFRVTEDNLTAVTEICHRLDGMPLAIELAAARMRALSVDDIVDSLHDRFRLLTGGARTAVRRQQTLRASVDWSHALLTEPERVLFRRLAVFMGGFDLDAAEAVCGDEHIERYQVLDQLTLLVDKSLVVAESVSGPTRYRFLETVRQYGLEKLGESGDAATVRTRHRDYYLHIAVALDRPDHADHERRLEQAAIEIDNLRAAFAWSREDGDVAEALRLGASLQPLWLQRGHIREGLRWLSAALGDDAGAAPTAERARALADMAMLESWLTAGSVERADEALSIARTIGDPALMARALTANGCVRGHSLRESGIYFAEAIGLARSVDDAWLVSQILGWQAYGSNIMGDPIAERHKAEEGRQYAESIGDRFVSRQCRWCLGLAYLWCGDLADSSAQFEEVAAEAEAVHDLMWESLNRTSLGWPLAYRGMTEEAMESVDVGREIAMEIQGIQLGHAYSTLALCALAAGDIECAKAAEEAAAELEGATPEIAAISGYIYALIALAGGDLDRARRVADESIAATVESPAHAAMALTAGTRVAMAEGEAEAAEEFARKALAHCAAVESYLSLADILECLAALAARTGSELPAARLLGASSAVRQRFGVVRFKVHDADYEASVTELRNSLGEDAFEAAWAEGAALSLEEAIAYARRGHGERKRPSTGWASLTPTELDVVRLVSDGLGNKDIATRMFVSHRTVQTHLTHVYAKLGITSRVALAQEAARHG